jgi:hypothetical protein
MELWKFIQPEQFEAVPCAAGSYCAFPQKNRNPGSSIGFWVIGKTRLRTCSQECAEIFLNKFKEGVLFQA